ncbi:hypothetical protein BN2475_1390002 [Paraburkholderia ribeironis]|uniref:Uncharacterized protein n=1 Tax=Paraburkholderia ribeironis TaxID=1247936 RepID=A0A1N7SPZ9_9BURK|nr:hypothetical protein BN2475_1390002 [Paraburkholderia ribeironis]
MALNEEVRTPFSEAHPFLPIGALLNCISFKRYRRPAVAARGARHEGDRKPIIRKFLQSN